MKQAAIISLGAWTDDSVFPLLTEFIAANRTNLRNRAFDAALRFLGDADHQTRAGSPARNSGRNSPPRQEPRRNNSRSSAAWCTSTTTWAVKLLEGYRGIEDDQVLRPRGKGLDKVRERKRARGKE